MMKNVTLLITVLLITSLVSCKWETRDDYIDRFKKAVVSTCAECFQNIPDADTKDFFANKLPTYQSIIY